MSENRISEYGTITLGGFIEALEEWCENAEKENDGAFKAKDCHVYFDWAMATPEGIDSYRGYYRHLALGYGDEDNVVTVGGLLFILNDAIGRTFVGWKGGDFTMDRMSPVWVGNPGHCYGTQIKGIQGKHYAAVIITGHEDDK